MLKTMGSTGKYLDSPTPKREGLYSSAPPTLLHRLKVVITISLYLHISELDLTPNPGQGINDKHCNKYLHVVLFHGVLTVVDEALKCTHILRKRGSVHAYSVNN